MRVISNKRLVEFYKKYADAEDALKAWRKALEVNEPKSFAELKAIFNSVDVIGDKYVFNIKGNNYRLVCGISFSQQRCYIKHVMTHADYDRGKWK